MANQVIPVAQMELAPSQALINAMDDLDLHVDDALSVASTDEYDDYNLQCNTPTTTVACSTSGFIAPSHTMAPWPGHTFVIRERTSGLTMTMLNGQLQLYEGFSSRGGFHWECVEKSGWLGFRNCVSGMYLGHNARGTFIAKFDQHKSHEFFTARAHPDGGYVLLFRCGDELLKVAVKEDSCSKVLVQTKGEGARWDFYRA
ncbi:hypothetical protein G7046_g3348 [Stylonectria norvegica]|nr:hypothetical protein G7046_g3348 [Stylonectria norvegica]